ncbi:putative transmembrane protein [Parvularcula bermudensis HTCC2503]|uniref:Putative transmembrane protein n=2 Tax=Parvularcula TaxID=208215 RepID=E0TFS3_PARBH|nr:putative transmembrane protein [Parvularcula bermudensis HTCC2503]
MKKRIFSYRWLRTGLAYAAAAAASLSVSTAQTNDNDLTAAILINFARFTTWPDQALTSNELKVCVPQGDEELTSVHKLTGKRVKDRIVSVRYFDHNSDQPMGCHIAVLSDAFPTLPAHMDKGTLVVALGEEVASEHTSLILITIGRQTRFIVNLTAARKQGISLRASLVDLAVKVY